jgi:hypothetical protein
MPDRDQVSGVEFLRHPDDQGKYQIAAVPFSPAAEVAGVSSVGAGVTDLKWRSRGRLLRPQRRAKDRATGEFDRENSRQSGFDRAAGSSSSTARHCMRWKIAPRARRDAGRLGAAALWGWRPGHRQADGLKVIACASRTRSSNLESARRQLKLHQGRLKED